MDECKTCKADRIYTVLSIETKSLTSDVLKLIEINGKLEARLQSMGENHQDQLCKLGARLDALEKPKQKYVDIIHHQETQCYAIACKITKGLQQQLAERDARIAELENALRVMGELKP